LFGLGAKEAIVHVRPADPQKYAATVARPVPPQADEEIGEDEDTEAEDDLEADFIEQAPAELSEDESELLQITRATVAELLEKMHVRAEVSARMSAPDDVSGRAAVMVDISGDDLSILIGRKAETLDALEYITRLIVGKEISSSALINLDVQGYRKRKEQRLRRIARTVARQAVETGRRQFLEPMNAAERRIIHIELRDHPEVYTESIGEGSRRKVTINLREN
jgi:spoIIIJ-associated protein